MGGTIASTVLTLLIVPLIYYMTERKRFEAKPVVVSDQNRENELDEMK